MVMNRSHFENSFSVSELKIAYLNNVAHRFTDIHDSYRQEKKRTLNRKAERRNYSSEEERARIAHKGFSGIPVPAKEAAHAAEKSGSNNSESRKLKKYRHNNKRNCYRSGNRGAESVYTVGKINRVNSTVNNEK